MLQSTLPRHERTSAASERLRVSPEKFGAASLQADSLDPETAPSPAPAVGGVLRHASACAAGLKQKECWRGRRGQWSRIEEEQREVADSTPQAAMNVSTNSGTEG